LIYTKIGFWADLHLGLTLCHSYSFHPLLSWFTLGAFIRVPWLDSNLVEMAIPLFIFAATICRYIGESGDSPRERLEIVLSYQRRKISQLDKTYLPILEHLIKGKDEEDKERWARKFQDLAGSIVILESPLPIASLSSISYVKTPEDGRRRVS
jgi:hypothetical protein